MKNFAEVMQILATIPATSCSAERSVSSPRRIKTYPRNTMGQQRLKNVTLINIERNYSNLVLEEDIDRIIKRFGRRP